MWVKYIEKIASKFTEGELVTLLSKDMDGKFKFAKYDLETPYNITGGNAGIQCSVSPTHRIVTGTCNYDSNQEKGITRRIVERLTFEGQGMAEGKELNYWHIYTNAAMDNILKLRLESGVINKDIDIFSPSYVFEGSDSSAAKLSKDISERIDDTLLVNLNLYNKHWVGIAIDKSDSKINLHYMDPEQQEMPIILKEQLENSLIEVYPYHQISLVEEKFEAQKYNNCGPEVIENFMSYLTGDRLSQEYTIHVHSLLFEDTVLADKLLMNLSESYL